MMGTRAHWFTSRYRATVIDVDGNEYGPTYGDTIADVRASAEDVVDAETVRVEKRVRDGYRHHRDYPVAEQGDAS